MAALKDAEPGTEIKLPDGSRAHIQPSEPGMRAVQVEQRDGRGWRLRVFDPSTTRPSFYPPDIPFIPDSKAAITDGSDGHVMATWETAEVDPVADQLIAQTTSGGWETMPEDPALQRLPLPMKTRQFRRGERTRVIMSMSAAGSGVVSMFDS